MSGPALFHIVFFAFVAVALLGVWGAFVLEAGDHSPGEQQQETAEPTDDAGETDAPERRAA
jgi:hypothetical protein